jgi:hypothetical protein
MLTSARAAPTLHSRARTPLTTSRLLARLRVGWPILSRTGIRCAAAPERLSWWCLDRWAGDAFGGVGPGHGVAPRSRRRLPGRAQRHPGRGRDHSRRLPRRGNAERPCHRPCPGAGPGRRLPCRRPTSIRSPCPAPGAGTSTWTDTLVSRVRLVSALALRTRTGTRRRLAFATASRSSQGGASRGPRRALVRCA